MNYKNKKRLQGGIGCRYKQRHTCLNIEENSRNTKP